MQSFRTEIENPIVEKDIIELERKITLYQEGKVDEDKFRSLRLARGVYGQRQPGVQMIRIKIPFGRLSTRQLRRIADISDEYSNGNLHATTRQDIQIHYVKLDRAPELWAKLEQDELTLREACGNTVRNITASAKAGVDPHEPFDVSPYAYEMFRYFLRNPICQEMGRKFKIALSSSEADSAFAFIHDVGAIPKVKTEEGKEIRGFKVLVGGGLGAQPHMAQVAYEFLPEDQLIPFTEALLRVFDRHGERNKRMKARMKFLMAQIGVDELLRLAEEERPGLKSQSYVVDRHILGEVAMPENRSFGEVPIANQEKYQSWRKTNVFEQKQKDYYGVHLRLVTGDLHSSKARQLADIVDQYAASDFRITVNQGYLLRFVAEEALPHLFNALDAIGLAEPGFDSTADITTCPGTDTCNLGISNSTGTTKVLEDVIRDNFPDLVYNNDIKIKISGCPNSCGQHGIASIGFHGSSIRTKDKRVVPALQVLFGGSVDINGAGRIAEKVIKVPSKRAPQILKTVLNDYDLNAEEGEYFADYYERQGKMYFYQLLKPLADMENLQEDEYYDWGHGEEDFKVEAGVGECAGVMIDLIATLLLEGEEKLSWAGEAFEEAAYADAVYHAYNAFITAAKSLLLSEDVKVNTQASVLHAFDEHFVSTGSITFEGSFEEHVMQVNKHEPTESFANHYIKSAADFLDKVKTIRDRQVNEQVEA